MRISGRADERYLQNDSNQFSATTRTRGAFANIYSYSYILDQALAHKPTAQDLPLSRILSVRCWAGGEKRSLVRGKDATKSRN